jgi:hypothetical protein
MNDHESVGKHVMKLGVTLPLPDIGGDPPAYRNAPI